MGLRPSTLDPRSYTLAADLGVKVIFQLSDGEPDFLRRMVCPYVDRGRGHPKNVWPLRARHLVVELPHDHAVWVPLHRVVRLVENEEPHVLHLRTRCE